MTKARTLLPAAALALLVALAGGPPPAPADSIKEIPSDWRVLLGRKLPLLGHRNWIVIADAAYPEQSRPGIETVATRADQLDVVKGVLEALGRARHVRPIVHLDAELEAVDERDAPGIGAYRAGLKKLLGDRETQPLAHEALIAKLDKAAETFKVLVLKTNLTLPYTSVFLQLDCGYWGADAEKRLRDKLGEGKKP